MALNAAAFAGSSDAPAWPRHTHHLGKRARWLLQVMEGETAADDVERLVGEGQRIDVALVPVDVAQAGLGSGLPRLLQHRRRGIEAHGTGDAAGEGPHHRARPAGDIERDVARSDPCSVHEQGECRLVVQGGGGGEQRRLAGELVGDGFGMRIGSRGGGGHGGTPGLMVLSCRPRASAREPVPRIAIAALDPGYSADAEFRMTIKRSVARAAARAWRTAC
jgi:hypothetical protein